MAQEIKDYGMRLLPTLIDNIASISPEKVYASIPNDDGNLSKGFKDITYAELGRAIDGVAWWLDETLGKADDGTFPTFAYFGPRDLGYAVVIVAAAKVGRKVLLPSHLASQEAHLFLLKALSCTAVIYASDLAPLAQSLRSHYSTASYICTPSLCTWLTNPDPVLQAQIYVYDKPYRAALNDPVMVVHTSGTTGMPKPVVWTHDMLACMDRLHVLPGPNSRARLEGQSIYSALPVFHTAGITSALLSPVYMGTAIILGPANTRPNKKTVLEVLRNVSVNLASLPPSLLEDLLLDKETHPTILKLQKIVYGGAPIAPWAAKILASDFDGKVTSTLGSTEGGLWLTAPAPDPSDGGYFLFHPFMSASFQQTASSSDELFELVIQRTLQSEIYTNFFRYMESTPAHLIPAYHDRPFSTQKPNEFRTKDLFSPHPHKKGLWKYICRKDDLILLSGEVKMYAGTMEEAISSHPLVSAAVIGGQSRSAPFLIVEPSSSSIQSMEHRDAFLEKIWGLVEEVNQKSFETVRLRRELVVVVGHGKSVVRTTKGSVDRKATFGLYEGEIDELYKRWSGIRHGMLSTRI